MLSSPFVRNKVASDVVQPKDVLVFLKFFNETSKEKEYECFQNELKIPGTKVDTIGLKGIRQKSKQYTNIDSFLTDINQLALSYMIHFQRKCPATYEKAIKFRQEWQKEVDTLKKCVDCYESWMNDKSREQTAYFKLVCPKPHLLVFVKEKGFPIWPAKLYYIKNGNANVECFGDYLDDVVPIRNCFLYSKKIPREYSNDGKKQKQLDLAYKEVKEHIKLIEKKFGAGSFVPAPSKIPITTDLTKHLKEMFPGAYAQGSGTANAIQATRRPSQLCKQASFEGQFTRNCSTPSMQVNTKEEEASEDSILEYSDFNGFSDDDSEDLNGHDDPLRTIKSEQPFEIEDVVENYSNHDLNESHARFEANPENTIKNGRNHGMQKRPHAGTKSQANPFLDRKSRLSQAGHASRADELEIIVLDDSDSDSDETNTTTEKKRKVLKEYNDLNKQIYILEIRLDALRKQSDKLGRILIQ